jgi:hypothetical protein
LSVVVEAAVVLAQLHMEALVVVEVEQVVESLHLLSQLLLLLR